MKKSVDPKDVVRLSVNLAPDVAATLKYLAASRSDSVTATIRRAIGVLQFLEAQERDGYEVVTRHKDDGLERRVILM